MMSNSSQDLSFSQKIWRAGFILALISVALILFKETIHIFILIIVGALIACYFRGVSSFIERKTKWKTTVTMLISTLGTLLVVLGIFYLMGATIVEQTTKLQEKFPELIEKSQDFLKNTETGNKVSKRIDMIKDSDELKEFVSSFFKTSFGGIGDLYVILLVGIYFTADPNTYQRGILQLVPPKNRDKANELMEKISGDLTKWLFGKFFSMSLVFVLTAIALAIIGIPLWLALSFIAGLLVFIPNFGPIIAAIPAILVALSQSTTMALMVLIVYIVIQVSEGSFITPKVQQRLVAIPPAVIILGQIFGGTLIGAWGVVFATPLVLILMVFVKQLYVHPMNKKAKEKLLKKP